MPSRSNKTVLVVICCNHQLFTSQLYSYTLICISCCGMRASLWSKTSCRTTRLLVLRELCKNTPSNTTKATLPPFRSVPTTTTALHCATVKFRYISSVEVHSYGFPTVALFGWINCLATTISLAHSSSY